MPGITGSWLLNTLGKTATWLAENLWAMAIAVGILLLLAARDWLTLQQPKLLVSDCRYGVSLVNYSDPLGRVRFLR